MRRVKGSIIFIIVIYIVIFSSCAVAETKHDFNPNYVTADSEKVYFVHINRDKYGEIQETFICYMDIGQEMPNVYDINIPKENTISRLATDEQDNLYALIKNVDIEDPPFFEIWEITKQGTIARKIDISNLISTQEAIGVIAFCLDKNGKFYIRELGTEETIVLSTDGEELWRIKDSNSTLFFEGMGRGKDGGVCCLFSQTSNENRQVILTYNMDKGDIDKYYEGNFFALNDIYSVIGAGVEGDIRVKGVQAVYEYSFGDEQGKFLADLSMYMRDANSTSTCFLKDGWLFMVTKRIIIEEEVVTIDSVRFHYVSLE